MSTWICPFCNVGSVLTTDNRHLRKIQFATCLGEPKYFETEIIECTNSSCQKFALNVYLSRGILSGSETSRQFLKGDLIRQWNLIPGSKAKPFPDYIPKAVLEDYEEACLICDLSPKAAATLARRCMQGMIRDFWKINKNNLKDAIDALEGRIDLILWRAIDATRSIGNIGAHMEKDINLIIDVDPDEARLLIGLIEMIIEDWYIRKHEKELGLKKIIEISETKESKRKSNSIK